MFKNNIFYIAWNFAEKAIFAKIFKIPDFITWKMCFDEGG